MREPDAIVAHAQSAIERGSKSFASAARLFDAQTRDSAYMLYAWCRHCDDVIDDQEMGYALDHASPIGRVERLAELRAQTEAALRGEAELPVFQALARVTALHAIPSQHPLDLIEGFRIDVERCPFRTIEDTLRYSYHVAGVVGVMMAMIMGARDEATLDRASDLGIAFQLTNIARDVMADFEVGRVYLPKDWLADAGIDARRLADPEQRDAVFAVTSRLLDLADAYYASARHGIPSLPLRAAWAVASARNIYRAIGGRIRVRGAGAWDDRVHVPASGKVVGIARAILTVARARAQSAIGQRPVRTGLWTRPRSPPAD